MRSRFITSAILLAFIAAASGCTGVGDALNLDPKVVTIEATVAAPAAAVEGSLPEGTPAWLPLWPTATVVEGFAADGTFDLLLNTSDEYDAVLAGVAQGFEDEGWQVAQEDLGGAGAGSRTTVLTVSGDRGEGVVTVTEDGSGTVAISYVMSPVE